ncbi:MAG: hypothetical protein IJT51_09995 [Bacteroidales bacterium]|nr:hypothetical protein [Bacteroidales bacterium]
MPYREFKIDSETYNKNPKNVVRQIILAVKDALNGNAFNLDNSIATEVEYDENDNIVTRDTKLQD